MVFPEKRRYFDNLKLVLTLRAWNLKCYTHTSNERKRQHFLISVNSPSSNLFCKWHKFSQEGYSQAPLWLVPYVKTVRQLSTCHCKHRDDNCVNFFSVQLPRSCTHRTPCNVSIWFQNQIFTQNVTITPSKNVHFLLLCWLQLFCQQPVKVKMVCYSAV